MFVILILFVLVVVGGYTIGASLIPKSEDEKDIVIKNYNYKTENHLHITKEDAKHLTKKRFQQK